MLCWPLSRLWRSYTRESASLSCSSSCMKCDRCAQLDLATLLLERVHCVWGLVGTFSEGIVYCDWRVPRASIVMSLGLRLSELGKESKSCAVEPSGNSYFSELTERTWSFCGSACPCVYSIEISFALRVAWFAVLSCKSSKETEKLRFAWQLYAIALHYLASSLRYFEILSGCK